MIPTLAIANPILTAPSAPLPIVALTSPQYPPLPGLPQLPDTDQPNHLLGMPLSAHTIPLVALPTRQSTRPHVKRTSDIKNLSAVSTPAPPAIPAPYIAIVHGDIDRITVPPLTPSEVADLLSVADKAWLRNTDHLARANSASIIERFECTDLLDDASDVDSDLVGEYATMPLNVNPDGSPLTYRTATTDAESKDWNDAEEAEIDLLIVTTTMRAIHLQHQPSDRRGDTTYYNPKPKEKYDDVMHKVYRIRGTAGGDRINYDGPTNKANAAALSAVKILLQSSVVSDYVSFMTLDV